MVMLGEGRATRRLLLAFACLAPLGSAAGQSSEPKPMPDSVRRYLMRAFDTLARVSMHRDSYDWSGLRDSVLARAAAAQTYEETWPVIQWMLRKVDRHSFLMTPRPMPARPGVADRPRPPRPELGGMFLDGRVGYILMPPFGGASR